MYSDEAITGPASRKKEIAKALELLGQSIDLQEQAADLLAALGIHTFDPPLAAESPLYKRLRAEAFMALGSLTWEQMREVY